MGQVLEQLCIGGMRHARACQWGSSCARLLFPFRDVSALCAVPAAVLCTACTDMRACAGCR
jgi:hypothetical protein